MDSATFNVLAFVLLAAGQFLIILFLVLLFRRLEAYLAFLQGQMDSLGEMNGDHQEEWRNAHRELVEKVNNGE